MNRRLRFAKNIIALISIVLSSYTKKNINDTNSANDTTKCYIET